MRARSRFVDANGLRHHLLEWNEPKPGVPAVLIFHGYLDQATSFRFLGDALAARGRHVVALDFRGHGDSAWVPEGGYYHFPDYVADAFGVLDAVVGAGGRNTPADIIAHSMGGTVATLVAGTLPARIASLVLLEGWGPPAMPPDVAPDRMERWIAGLAKKPREARSPLTSIDDAVARLRLSHSHIPDDTLRRVAMDMTRVESDGTLLWRFDPLHQTTSPGRFDAEAFEAFARRVTARVLWVDGGPTGFAVGNVRDRAAWFARVEHASLPNAGHMMHWTEPEALTHLVAGWLIGRTSL